MSGDTGEVPSFYGEYLREKARADKAETELARLRGTMPTDNSPQLGGTLAPGGPRTPAQDVMARALSLAPDNTFVRSCAAYFQTHGRLSAKQMASLERIRPEAPANLRRVAVTLAAFLDDEEYEDADMGWIGPDEMYGGPH